MKDYFAQEEGKAGDLVELMFTVLLEASAARTSVSNSTSISIIDEICNQEKNVLKQCDTNIIQTPQYSIGRTYPGIAIDKLHTSFKGVFQTFTHSFDSISSSTVRKRYHINSLKYINFIRPMNRRLWNFFSIITGKTVRPQQKFCSPTGRFEPTSKPGRREKLNWKNVIFGSLILLSCYASSYQIHDTKVD